MTSSVPSEYFVPICTNPIVQDNYLGLIYCVFQAAPVDLLPVLSNYYTNISFGISEKTKYSHVFDDHWLMHAGITYRQHFVLHKEMFEQNPQELLNLIRELISADYYLVGNNDTYYIRAKAEYQCVHTSSAFLIYGFNQQNRVFYSIGKTKDAQFAKYEIPYDELVDSLFFHENNTFYLDFYHYNEDIKPVPDLKKIYNGIVDYLDSTKKGDDPLARPIDKIKYGLNCYRHFLASLSYVGEYVTYIDPSEYTVFFEHHILMSKRLEVLSSIGVIPKDIVEQYDSVTEKSRSVYNACISYNNEKNPIFLKEISSLVEEIISTETVILRTVTKKIRNAVQ